MKLAAAWISLVFVACGGGGDDYAVTGDDMPSHPGSGGAGPDAAVPGDAGSGSGIAGRVCLAADSRDLTACAGTGVAGYVVSQLGGSGSAVTGDDGSFAYEPTAVAEPWLATDTNIVQSVVLTSAPGDIPAIAADLYATMIGNTGALIGNGQGGLIVRVRSAGSAAVGALVVSNDAVSDVYYDTTDDTTWDDDQAVGTGTFGDAWIPIAPEGTISLSVTPHGSITPVAVTGVVIVDQAVTYIDVNVP